MDEDQRRHLRLRTDILIRWHIDPDGPKEKGAIRDISLSGALLEIESKTSLKKDTTIVIRTIDPNDTPSLSCRARVCWCRRAVTERSFYYCGLLFQERSQNVADWIKRHEDALGGLSDVGIIKNYLNFKEKN